MKTPYETNEIINEALREIRRLNAAAGETVFNPAVTTLLRSLLTERDRWTAESDVCTAIAVLLGCKANTGLANTLNTMRDLGRITGREPFGVIYGAYLAFLQERVSRDYINAVNELDELRPPEVPAGLVDTYDSADELIRSGALEVADVDFG